MPASAWLQGPAAFAVEALAEAAVTGIAMTTLPPGMDVEPVTLVMDYFRPPRAQQGNLLARARVVNASRFFTFTEVEIEDPQGRQIVHGSSHARIRAIEPVPPPPPAELRAAEDPAYATPDPILRPVSGSDPPIEVWQENDGYAVLRMYLDGQFRSPFQKLFGSEGGSSAPSPPANGSAGTRGRSLPGRSPSCQASPAGGRTLRCSDPASPSSFSSTRGAFTAPFLRTVGFCAPRHRR